MGMPNLDARVSQIAHRQFPNNAQKQSEYALEIGIGYMMAAEATLWNPA
jgi:hypothetical protein